ncbi:DUF2959 family protein [Nibricoccus sp. IMCC34717]|uniref:DUF2959 family protein n=1 Tax=Nibricoccus sp. IMCC34717 TaxID=3034021 RepID=UPI00384F3024
MNAPKCLLRSALVLVLIGAFSSLSAGQDELKAAIQQNRTETVLTHNQLVTNIKSLDALVAQKEGDLRPAFGAFTASLIDTRAASDRTAKRVAALKVDGEKYFAIWRSEIEQIQDAGIKNRATKRLDSAVKNWNGVTAALEEATVRFPALLGYLRDVEKALTYDLTEDGVKSVRGAARSASESFGEIQRLVQTAVTELDQLSDSMSSVIKAS